MLKCAKCELRCETSHVNLLSIGQQNVGQHREINMDLAHTLKLYCKLY